MKGESQIMHQRNVVSNIPLDLLIIKNEKKICLVGVTSLFP